MIDRHGVGADRERRSKRLGQPHLGCRDGVGILPAHDDLRAIDAVFLERVGSEGKPGIPGNQIAERTRDIPLAPMYANGV